MRNYGAYTQGVARLEKYGDVRYGATGGIEGFSDVYGVVMGRGVRPTTANVAGLPAVNSAHPEFTELFCASLMFSCSDNETGYWTITAEWGPSEAATTGTELDTLRIISRDWDVSETLRDLVADAITGELVVNAAGDPFDSVPQRTDSAFSVSFTRLESRAPARRMMYNGTVNLHTVTVLGVTFLPYTARIKITGTDTMQDALLRYRLTYTIEARANIVETTPGNPTDIGWREALLECGYQFIDADGAKMKFTERIKNTEGEEEEREVSSPQLLTATGGDGRGLVPVVRVVNTHRAASWAALDLPAI